MDVQDPAQLHAEIAPRPPPAILQPGDDILGRQPLVLDQVGVGRDRGLAVADVLPRHVRAQLVNHQREVVGAAQALLDGHIDLDEVLEVAELIPGAQPFDRVRRQGNAVALG